MNRLCTIIVPVQLVLTENNAFFNCCLCRERSRDRDKDKKRDQEDEEEAYERRKLERKLRDKEAAYQEVGKEGDTTL